LTNTLSEGLVSGVRGAEETGEVSLIQTTAAISHGSSGGALMTADGTVVGVTKGAIEDGQNLNFAVPAELVRKLIASRASLRTLASATSETLSPRDAAAYVNVLEALDHGKFEQAASLMKNLSDRQRNTPTYWFTTGCLHYKLQNLDLAEQAFKDAIKLRPEFSAAYARLGDVYNYQNENDKALDAYRKAVQINPRESRAYCGAGFVFGKQGQFDKAVAIFDKGLAANPKDIEMLGRKGIMLGAAKRFAEAEKAYAAALKLDEKCIDIYLYMGETYQKWRKWDKAMAAYRKAIGYQPDNAMAYLNLGVAAFNAGDSKTAYYAWRNARRFDPYGPVGGSARDYLEQPKTALRQ
jgi:tetratricopeptide (TPR) repeat protein